MCFRFERQVRHTHTHTRIRCSCSCPRYCTRRKLVFFFCCFCSVDCCSVATAIPCFASAPLKRTILPTVAAGSFRITKIKRTHTHLHPSTWCHRVYTTQNTNRQNKKIHLHAENSNQHTEQAVVVVAFSALLMYTLLFFLQFAITVFFFFFFTASTQYFLLSLHLHGTNALYEGKKDG